MICENKGIDWLKDNIYDGIGKPDLKTKDEEYKMAMRAEEDRMGW